MTHHTNARVLNRTLSHPPVKVPISFSVDSVIRGHHIYKDIWTPNLGEILPCKVEPGNVHDPYAVAVERDQDDTTIGHVPRSISAVCKTRNHTL